MKPLFSIITPVFNGVAKIERTIDSVLSQEAAAWEYLVVDGGSTDGTVDRLRTRGEKLRWVSESDRGIYDAMNKGIEMADGRFLFFVGAGDTLLPGVLARVAEEVKLIGAVRDLRPWFLYGDVTWGSTGKRYDGPFSKFKLTRKNICHQAIFYDARIFERLGEFGSRYPMVEDHHFNIRCFADSGVRRRYLDLVVAIYEAGGVSERTPDRAFIQELPEIISRQFGRRYLLASNCAESLERLGQRMGGLSRRLGRVSGNVRRKILRKG